MGALSALEIPPTTPLASLFPDLRPGPGLGTNTQFGSFTGAVASNNVSGVYQGSASLISKDDMMATHTPSLTVRLTSQTGTQVCGRDPEQ